MYVHKTNSESVGYVVFHNEVARKLVTAASYPTMLVTIQSCGKWCFCKHVVYSFYVHSVIL